MYLLYPITTILVTLAPATVFIITMLFRANKIRIKQNEKMIADWQLQNAYMDHTLEFCMKAKEITREVRSAIESRNAGGPPDQKNHREQRCIRECGQLLNWIHGGDTAAEALLLDKKNLCKTRGIVFIDEIITLPTDRIFPQVDAVSVMGNLLDNAIEAADLSGSENPTVEFSSILKKKVWIITATNSKDPGIFPKRRQMATTKKDRENHGLGFNIIRSIAAKYNGSVKAADLGDRFQVKVYLFTK